jgi:hypothetical protein
LSTEPTWLLVTYLQSFTDLWTRRIYVILVSVKVVFWVKAISYTFFAHYFALPSNTTGWNPINRYHTTTFLCLFLASVLRFRLVTVLLVSVLNRLRFVNGIVRVVVSYFVFHYCLAVYSQYYFILCFHL